MLINEDLNRLAEADTNEMEWVASSSGGVERKMLERDGDEVARATTIVRFAPGSSFPEHEHGAGEEFLVLEGTFSDETGDYPAGTYVRNPKGTAHASSSKEGCTIFVKLRQFQDDDDKQVVIDTNTAEWQAHKVEGVTFLPLHRHGEEFVRLTRYAPGARFPYHKHPRGEELLVLDGVLTDEEGTYPAGTWVRFPHGSDHRPFSDEGCMLYVKSGHLPLPPKGEKD